MYLIMKSHVIMNSHVMRSSLVDLVQARDVLAYNTLSPTTLRMRMIQDVLCVVCEEEGPCSIDDLSGHTNGLQFLA